MFFNNLVDVTNENENENRKYANTLLEHATQLYSAAYKITPYLTYQKSVPTMDHVYSSSGLTINIVVCLVNVFFFFLYICIYI